VSLADERRSRRFREPDPLEFRVFVFIVGGAFFVLLGCCMLFVSVLGSRRLVEKWSEASGNHEVSIVIFLVALPIAWIIRRVIRGDAA
jgi:hypothetical protein